MVANAAMVILSHRGNKGLSEKSWRDCLADRTVWYNLCFMAVCLIGLREQYVFVYALLLWDIVLKDDTLRNVIRSVTHNWQSIAMTGLLAGILVYHFAIIGYINFQKDFVAEYEPTASIRDIADPNAACDAYDGSVDKDCTISTGVQHDDEDYKYEACNTLRSCILFTAHMGLRSGGGIGDVLRKVAPTLQEDSFNSRAYYDMTFYVLLIVIVLNLVFGVIIDTFGDLRNSKNENEDILLNTCFICGLERAAFDNQPTSFQEHCENEHQWFHYLCFIVLLQKKDPTEFTGPESYVHNLISERIPNIDWFPRMQAMCFVETNNDGGDELHTLAACHDQLKAQAMAIAQLQQTVEDIKQVSQTLRRAEKMYIYQTRAATVQGGTSGFRF